MKSYKHILYIIFFIFTFKTEHLHALEIKIIAKVDEVIITNQDLRKEKVILNYLFNNKIDENSLDKIALENLIETNIKRLEIKKNNILISDSERDKFLKIVLKNNNKSLDDFRLKTKNKFYEIHLKDKIKTEISWNKLVLNKFSNNISINLDEVIAKTINENNSSKKIDILILDEKNKKLQSISETYFNEIKTKTLIKFL